MSFLCKQISDNRWGIYSDTRLLATVSDRATCEAIMANFQNARKETPADWENLPTSSKKTVFDISASKVSASDISAKGADSVEALVDEDASQPAVSSGEPMGGKTISQRTRIMSDDDLAKVLNVKSLKVKELESAVLRAQRNQNK